MPKRRIDLTPPGPRVQHAVLPHRRGVDGALEVMLLTSRETKRWVVPKGWPMKGLKGHRTAAREAFEEAGLVGVVKPKPIGFYPYAKRMAGGSVIECVVRVYPMRVAKQRKRWPERGEREAQWFTPEAAAAEVHEPELAALILGLAAHLGAPTVLVPPL